MEPDVRFSVFDGEDWRKIWQLIVVKFDEFADGDGVHGAAVLAFDGDGAFAFGSVATGGFRAALLLFFGQDFAHRRLLHLLNSLPDEVHEVADSTMEDGPGQWIILFGKIAASACSAVRYGRKKIRDCV